MGACARNMSSNPAEIKSAQFCIKLVFHLTCTMMHWSTKLKHFFQFYYLDLNAVKFRPKICFDIGCNEIWYTEKLCLPSGFQASTVFHFETLLPNAVLVLCVCVNTYHLVISVLKSSIFPKKKLYYFIQGLFPCFQILGTVFRVFPCKSFLF